MKTWGTILAVWLVSLLGIAALVNYLTTISRDRQWLDRIAAGEFVHIDTVEYHHRDTLWRIGETQTGVVPPYIPDTAAYIAEIERLQRAFKDKDEVIAYLSPPAKWTGDLVDGVWLQTVYTPTQRTFWFRTTAATYVDSVVRSIHAQYAVLQPYQKPFFGGLYAEAMAGGDYGDKLIATDNKRLDIVLGAELWPSDRLMVDLSPARLAVVGTEVGVGWRVGLRYKIIQP